MKIWIPTFSYHSGASIYIKRLSSLLLQLGHDVEVSTYSRFHQFFPYFPDRKDPYLVTVAARVKNPADVWTVRDEIVKEFANLRQLPISPRRLAEIKGNLSPIGEAGVMG